MTSFLDTAHCSFFESLPLITWTWIKQSTHTESYQRVHKGNAALANDNTPYIYKDTSCLFLDKKIQ